MADEEEDGQLEEPLLHHAAELFEDTTFGDGIGDGNEVADLLDDLRALEDLEHGGPVEYIEEEDVYKIQELIEEKPRDVIQYIEEEGIIKLGEFDVEDVVAFKVFSKKPLITLGDEHLDCDWECMWRDTLNEQLEQAHARVHVQAGWSTSLRLEAHAVKIRDAAAPGSKGLLQPLLKRYQARGCPVSVFGLPAVQAVIHFKWATWAARLLGYELALYATWLLSFITFSLLFEGEDAQLSLLQLLGTSKGLAAVVCDLVALVAMLPFVYMEFCTIATYGSGWFNLWNSLDVLTYVLQVLISGLHLLRFDIGGNWFSVLVATQHLVLWSKMHYYARVFTPTKNLLADTFLLVIDDTKWFLLYVLLTMLGFMFAFFSLFRQDRDTVNDFSTLWHSFAAMFAYLLAMFDLNILYNSTNPAAAMVLFIIYEFIMNIMLLNIMIAIMARSFDKVINDQGLRFLSSRAQIIDELESTLPSWCMNKAWYPPFVHILKVQPGSTYDVNLGSVWSSMGLMENNLLNAQQETRRRLEQMEVELDQANNELDLMISSMMDMAARQGYEGAGREREHGEHGRPGHRDLHHQATWAGPAHTPGTAEEPTVQASSSRLPRAFSSSHTAPSPRPHEHHRSAPGGPPLAEGQDEEASPWSSINAPDSPSARRGGSPDPGSPGGLSRSLRGTSTSPPAGRPGARQAATAAARLGRGSWGAVGSEDRNSQSPRQRRTQGPG